MTARRFGTTTTDALHVLREYTCGCITYLRYSTTANGMVEADERGLLCAGSGRGHRAGLVRGRETQPGLRGLGGDA